MSNNKSPIGVFDSGVGGISVLKEAFNIMPNEDFIFFGDCENAPYGTKPVDKIKELTFKNVEYLLNLGAKAIMVACNTATSAAVRSLREMYPELPIVGIEPAIKPAVEAFSEGNILVMATPMTIKQDKFKFLLEKYRGNADVVPMACPGLMEFVERGELDTPELKAYLEQIITLEEWDSDGIKKHFDVIVLGCTHYPFVKKAIREVAGDGPMIIDGSLGTAQELKRRIAVAGLDNPDKDREGYIFKWIKR